MTETTAYTTPLAAALKASKVEKDVENAYRAELQKLLPGAKITSPYDTDGVLETDVLHVLLEFKYDHDFTKASDVAKPLVQALVYLRKFYEREDRLPSAVFVGDINECFALPTDVLIPYLSRNDVDWSVAPSSAWKDLPEIYREIVTDENINPHVLKPQVRLFIFRGVIDHLEAICAGTVHRVPITIHNIAGIYTSWEEKVLKGKVEAQTAVNAFIQCVLGEAYLHPRRKNTLMVNNEELAVDSKAHKAFFDWFQSEYRVTEKRKFTAIKDRLLDDAVRRRGGDFYTPTPWADEAHKMLDAELGPDWRDEWAVWDCAAGTANLTRDYTFKDLYLSTLYPEDVATMQSMGYNAGAEIFQFDFLNDPLPGEETLEAWAERASGRDVGRIPEKLKETLESGRKMVFLINPPFGTAAKGVRGGSNKAGAGDSVINERMDVGACKQQLYVQFMWRISEIVERYALSDAVLSTYAPPLFLSGSDADKFRMYFYKKWRFMNGFVFRSGEFDGTSKSWGCSFTTWRKK